MNTKAVAASFSWRTWLRAFLPARQSVNARERLRAALGGFIGITVTALLCRAMIPSGSVLPWLVAPLGASSVLVFGVPASPLGQPWSVIGGNTISALVGILCVMAFGHAPWVAGLAVGLAIAAMFTLRCLHPPGGASALLMVLTAVHDPLYALFPVGVNSLLLVVAGMAYNHATGRRYPHAQASAPAPSLAAEEARSFITPDDLDVVLARYNQVLDLSRDDLRELLQQAEQQAHVRRLGEIRCRDIMTAPPVTVSFATTLEEAWALLRQRRIKALPVVDRVGHVIGIVTQADFMRSNVLDLHHGWPERLREFLRPSLHAHSDKAEVVGQVMTRSVRVISADRPIGELLPLFSATGHHHIPVINEGRRIVGVVTQSDMVRTLAARV